MQNSAMNQGPLLHKKSQETQWLRKLIYIYIVIEPNSETYIEVSETFFICIRPKMVFEIFSLEETDVTAQCFLRSLLKTRNIDIAMSVPTLTSAGVFFSKRVMISNTCMHRYPNSLNKTCFQDRLLSLKIKPGLSIKSSLYNRT